MTGKAPIATASFPAKTGTRKLEDPVTVEMEGDDIVVQWVTSCARRRFTPAGLRAVVDHIETCAALGDDVWLEHEDENGRYFAVLIADGRAYGGEQILEPDQMDNVSWAKLRAALNARARMAGPERE